jgi:hypothetical protein
VRVKPVPLVGFAPIGKHKRPRPPKPPPASSVTLTDQMWVCGGSVDPVTAGDSVGTC